MIVKNLKRITRKKLRKTQKRFICLRMENKKSSSGVIQDQEILSEAVLMKSIR